MKEAHFLVPLTKKASMICTFLTDQGKFRMLRGIQGLSSTNDEFLIRTNEGFRGSPGMVRLIDDVLVQGETLEELYVNLRCCLERCRAMNITMGLEKLKVTGPGEKLSFAGYQISDAGFHPDFRKTAAIADFPRPTCQTDIKSWMGLCNQLGSFVFNLSSYVLNLLV